MIAFNGPRRRQRRLPPKPDYRRGQELLFRDRHPNLPPNTHGDDPTPAVLAGRAVSKSGLREHQLRIVMRVVVQTPGLAAPEIGALARKADGEPMGHVAAQRRLSDALRAKPEPLVTRGAARKVFGHQPCCSWWPTDAGRRYVA